MHTLAAVAIVALLRCHAQCPRSVPVYQTLTRQLKATWILRHHLCGYLSVWKATGLLWFKDESEYFLDLHCQVWRHHHMILAAHWWQLTLYTTICKTTSLGQLKSPLANAVATFGSGGVWPRLRKCWPFYMLLTSKLHLKCWQKNCKVCTRS